MVNKDGNVTIAKVSEALDRIDPEQKEVILKNFEDFRSYLGKRIQLAQKIGLGEEQLAAAAEKIADYLAAHEEPRNSEEKLLLELWKVGSKEERHRLAHMLVKLARN
ncbi:hypothetical protein D3C74_407170 [compost metagenome]